MPTMVLLTIDNKILYYHYLRACASSPSVVVVVVVGTKIARFRVLGVCAHCNYNKSVEIAERLVFTNVEWVKMAY